MKTFFQHQEKARKHTTKLIFLFCLAIGALVLGATLLTALFFGVLGGATTDPYGTASAMNAPTMDAKTVSLITLIVLIVVGGGSLFKLLQLSKGGASVAEMLGGTLVTHNTRLPQEKQLLNIVEEMSIASGVPVPPVYVMRDEPGINAFAAGFKPKDAVIGVTQGCMDLLNREEMQGVIGHEFSHILNGDMRINIRLMGILHGITIIGMIGYQMIYHFRFAGVARSRQENGGAQMGMFAFAFGLIAIGYGGVFFGNLIKAAVSRQREYLADASAVQFTRNPDGIASALDKIASHAYGAEMQNPNAKEASHMFFGSTVTGFLSGLFATHPPISERIQRISPNWQGNAHKKDTGHTSSSSFSNTAGVSGFAGGTPQTQTQQASNIDGLAEETISRVGTPNPNDVDTAVNIITATPSVWHEYAHTHLGARAAIYTLLLNTKGSNAFEKQWIHINNIDHDAIPFCNELLGTPIEDESQRLSIIDMTLPHLASIKVEFYPDFLQLLSALIKADNKIDLFEWSLYAIVENYLKSKFEPRKSLLRQSAKYKKLDNVTEQCNVVLSLLSLAGNKDEGEREKAFASAVSYAELSGMNRLDKEGLSIDKLSEALSDLSRLYPLIKPKLLKACVACIASDGVVTATESELLRAIGDTLDCPLPPVTINS